MSNLPAVLLVAAASIMVQAIGFFYVTRNHLAHMQESLDRIEARLLEHESRLSVLEGRTLERDTYRVN